MSEPDISNLARRLAEQNNVAWQSLSGSGPDGRVVERDVLDYLARVMAGEEALDPTPEPLPEGMEAWTEVGADSVGNYSRPIKSADAPPPELSLPEDHAPEAPASVEYEESVTQSDMGSPGAADAASEIAELGDDVFLFDDDDDDFETPDSLAGGEHATERGDVQFVPGGFPADAGSVDADGLVTPDLEDDLLLVSGDDLSDDDLAGDDLLGDAGYAPPLEAAEVFEPSGEQFDAVPEGVAEAQPEAPAAWSGSELRLDSDPYEPVPTDAADLWEDGGDVGESAAVGGAMFESDDAAPAGETFESGEAFESGGSLDASDSFETGGAFDSGEALEAGDSFEAGETFESGEAFETGETFGAGEWAAEGTASGSEEVAYGETESDELRGVDAGGQTETGSFHDVGAVDADLGRETPAVAGLSGAIPLVRTPNLLRRNVDVSALAAAQLAAGLELGLEGPLSVAPFLVRAAAKAAHDVGLAGGQVAMAEIQAGILLRRVDGAVSMAFVDLVRELEGVGTEEDEVALVAVDLSMLDVDEAFLDVGAPTVTLGRILYDSEVGGYRSTLALTGDLPLDQGSRLLARVAELLTSPVRLLV